MICSRLLKRRFALIAFAVVSLIAALPAAAQLSNTPLDAHRYTWKKISSAHYEVIFPDFLEERGRYVSSTLEYLWPLQQRTIMPTRLFRYPVILNPDQISPNGYVSILPRRSYYYTAPDSATAGDWLTLLAAHEGRHMFQFDAMNRGTIHALSFFVGEYAAAVAATSPSWWFEGDAVMTETALTESGRGRNPRFTAQFKALMLEGKVFNYNKMLLGSYADKIPNSYEFGYLMYSYIRAQYDPKAPETLLGSMAKCPLPALGPHLAMRRACGKGASAVYREMAEQYGRFWKEQTASLAVTPAKALTTQKKSTYREHRFIAACADGSVVASVLDYDRGTEIVRVKDGKETPLCKGYPLNSLGAGGNLLVWDSLEANAKFDASSSRIVLFDLDKGCKRTLFSGSRYISPALSPDGSIVAMVEFGYDTACALVTARTSDGSILNRYPIPRGEIWSDLSFAEGGAALVFISNNVYERAGHGGKYLGSFEFATGTKNNLYDAGMENIGSPVVSGGVVYYVSNSTGIDSVWAIDGDGKRYQVISRTIGAYCPLPASGGDGIRFVDYANSRGTVIAEADVPRASWIPADSTRNYKEEFFASAAESEPGRGMAIPANVPLNNITAERYSPVLEGNRVDAWGILPLANGDSGLTGFVQAANVTGIVEQRLAFSYDDTDRSLGGSYQIRYRGFWPDVIVQAGDTLEHLDGGVTSVPWGSAGLELPYSGGTLGDVSWKGALGTSGGGRIKDGEAETVLTVYTSDMATCGRWALTVYATWEYLPLSSEKEDHPYAYATLAMPGILSRDSITFSGAYERLHDADDSLSLVYARGYHETYALEAWKASALYAVPLCYPDFAIGSLAYFDMIKFDAFFDHREALDIDETQSSVGAELLFHFNPLQIPIEINAGVRYSRQIREGVNVIELVILGIPVASF